MSDQVVVTTQWIEQIPVVHLSGVLDARSYMHVRNAILKGATDAPDAVVVDVGGLTATSASAWTVLTSASWLIRQWPGIPLMAVADSPARRAELTRNAVTRYVPVHDSVDSALDAIRDRRDYGPTRLRVRHHRPRTSSALLQMRDLVSETLENWDLAEAVPAARCVASVLSGNVLQHTDSDLDMRIEARGKHVTVAMYDGNTEPAVLREASAPSHIYVSGLAIVSALSHSWGSVPTADGKTVWAVLSPHQYLALYR